LVADNQVIRFQIAPPEGVGISGGGNLGAGFAVSPDGQTAAFVGVVKGKTGLWVRPLDAPNARLIRGSEGASRPFWSPDSRSIAYGAGGVLHSVDLSRETISKICDVSGVYWGGSWSSDGRIFFVIRDAGFFKVPATGGAPSQLTAVGRVPGELAHDDPQPLPGGRFLYGAISTSPGSRDFYAASLTKSAERVRLLANATQARYVSARDGEDYLLWIRDRTVVGQRFDADKLRFIGGPHSLADPAAAVSVGGRVLLFGFSVALRQLKWLDRRGNEVGLLGEPGPWAFLRVSPDGRHVVTIRAGDNPGIWLLETGRGIASRLSPATALNPVWSPDGRTILFSTPSHLSRIGADGTGSEEPITQSQSRQSVSDWSRDVRLIIYTELAPDNRGDLWVLP